MADEEKPHPTALERDIKGLKRFKIGPARQTKKLTTDANDEAKISAVPLYKELLRINAKDGTFTEAEKKRLDVLNKILAAAPDLKKTLVNLDARQRKEIEDLVTKQRREPSETFGQQHADLEQRHDKERDRHIREFQNAKAIRDDMARHERAQTLQDNPKRTR
jgi:hypothetical protein